MRHDRATEDDERAAARGRLDALRLRPPAGGWVPDAVVVEPADPRPDTVSAAVVPVPTIGGLARAWAMDRSPVWAHGAIERGRLGALMIGLGVVVVAIAVGVVLLHHRSASGSSSYDFSDSTVASPAASAAASDGATVTSIVVDVGGRVRKPGLVTLPAGARVADAIAAAGGPLHHKELDRLDLAARVSDGELLLVGVQGAPAAGASDGGTDSSGTGPPAPVSLSTATIEELETLPGVGPVTAQKIIDWRTAHNGFTSVIQLQQVSGIGPARYAELSPLVTP
jgi:competence protein ComEA